MSKLKGLPIGFVGTCLGLATLSNVYNLLGYPWVRHLCMWLAGLAAVLGVLKVIFFFDKVKETYNKVNILCSKGDYTMGNTKETEEGYTTVELTLDNDEVLECAILTVYEAAGKEYIALLPLDENLEPNEAGDVYLYQYNETEDGEPDLGNIEDDEEYEIAADAFDEWMDSQDFDDSDIIE